MLFFSSAVLAACGPCGASRSLDLTSVSRGDLARDQAAALMRTLPKNDAVAIFVQPSDLLKMKVERIFIGLRLVEKRNGVAVLSSKTGPSVQQLGQGMFYINIGRATLSMFVSADDVTACDETHSEKREYHFRERVVALNELGSALLHEHLLYRFANVDAATGTLWSGLSEVLDERYVITRVAPSDGMTEGNYLGFPWASRRLQ